MAWIKQKSDNDDPRPASIQSSRPSASAHQQPQSPPQQQQRERKVADRPANIGQSVQIKGDLTGQEDLTIEGKLEGKVLLDSHQLTIGANGRIQGEIRARTVIVVGELIGNIDADERVEVAASGSMRGNIRAPRVVLVDGADFRGSVDMDSSQSGARQQVAETASSSPIKNSSEGERDSKPAALTGATK